MRKLLLAVAAIIGFTALFAQDKRMFKGKFYNRQNGITIAIDRYDRHCPQLFFSRQDARLHDRPSV